MDPLGPFFGKTSTSGPLQVTQELRVKPFVTNPHGLSANSVSNRINNTTRSCFNFKDNHTQTCHHMNTFRSTVGAPWRRTWCPMDIDLKERNIENDP